LVSEHAPPRGSGRLAVWACPFALPNGYLHGPAELPPTRLIRPETQAEPRFLEHLHARFLESRICIACDRLGIGCAESGLGMVRHISFLEDPILEAGSFFFEEKKHPGPHSHLALCSQSPVTVCGPAHGASGQGRLTAPLESRPSPTKPACCRCLFPSLLSVAHDCLPNFLMGWRCQSNPADLAGLAKHLGPEPS
jgi:hypothetical protein